MVDIHPDIVMQLYSKPQTIFTVNEVSQLFPDISYKSIRDRLYYFTKTGKLQRVRHGIYAKSSYDPLELANKIYRPSYISLETVLEKGGVIFQYYKTIFAVSYLTRLVTATQTTVQYRQIPADILTNMQGIEQHVGYAIATLERAFLDAIYIYKNYHFDHLGVINWDIVNTLKPLYKSKSFAKRVESYRKDNYADR